MTSSSLPRAGSLAAGLALLVAAAPALAGGINLSWDDCGGFGSAQRNFACNTNLSSHVLFLSVVPSVAMPALNGHEATITITTPQAALPPWWQKQVGGCRAGTPATSPDFVAGPFNCRDVWSGQAVAGASYDYPIALYGTAVGRIRTISALPAGMEESVDTVQELYLIKVSIDHQKTVGPGACAGCTESACIVLQSVKLVGPMGAPTQTISNPALRQHVIWQNAAALPGCPGATPARNRTWGGIKTLYR